MLLLPITMASVSFKASHCCKYVGLSLMRTCLKVEVTKLQLHLKEQPSQSAGWKGPRSRSGQT